MLSPFSPLTPGSPWGPIGPIDPFIPFGPRDPFRPLSPWSPLSPWGPFSPGGPWSPGGPGIMVWLTIYNRRRLRINTFSFLWSLHELRDSCRMWLIRTRCEHDEKRKDFNDPFKTESYLKSSSRAYFPAFLPCQGWKRGGFTVRALVFGSSSLGLSPGRENRLVSNCAATKEQSRGSGE